MAAPARVLGTFDATCVVIGAIVGVGIFFNPSKMASLVRSDALLLVAWGVASIIALCGSLTFAELGSRRNAPGAQYDILRDAFGPLPAFLFVFCNATAIQAGAIGIIAVVCVQNLAAVAGLSPGYLSTLALSLGAIASLTVANAAGVRWGSRIQNFTVVLKIAALLVIASLAVVAAPSHAPPAAPQASPDGVAAVTGVLAALVPALFAFGGWQHSLWICGEVRDARRVIPRAVVGGVVVVALVYCLANWSYLRLLGGWEAVANSKALAADAVGAVSPQVGRRLIAAAVGVSAFGVLNAQLLSGPRLLYGMASDGRFFRPFARLSGSGTPAGAIALLGFMGAALLVVAGEKGLDRLLTGVVFIDGVFFILTGTALFVLRRKDPPDAACFRAPGYPLVPALFVIGEIGVVVGAHLDPSTLSAAIFGVAWIVLSVVVYFAFFRRR